MYKYGTAQGGGVTWHSFTIFICLENSISVDGIDKYGGGYEQGVFLLKNS